MRKLLKEEEINSVILFKSIMPFQEAVVKEEA